jgi:DNA end-binding protein Ku
MPRAIWSGSISFGLVNVPVKVYAAVREHTVHFHQVDKASGSRIRYEKVAEKTGKEVAGDDIELGYEMDKGTLVVVDPDQLAELRPRTTRTIDISDFVQLAQIDPVFYARTYWLAPDGEGAARAYRLLVAAMEDRGKVGIGMVVMRNKQYLAAVRPREHALALSTMHFADEVIPRSSLDALPAPGAKPAAKELRLATQIIDSMSADWKPEAYRDTYTEDVQALITRQARGQEVIVEEAPAAKTKVVDLMAALEASLDAARKPTRGTAAKKPKPAKKAAARKSA